MSAEEIIEDRSHVAAGVIEREALELAEARNLDGASVLFQIACAAAVDAESIQKLLASRRRGR